MAGSELLDKAAAADYINSTYRHIERLWSERRITGYRIGGKIRFKKSDLDEFIESGRLERLR